MRCSAEEVLEVAARLGWSQEEIERRFGPVDEIAATFTAKDIQHLIVIEQEVAAKGGRLVSPGFSPAPTMRARGDSRPVSVGQVLATSSGAAAAGVEQVEARATGRPRAPCGPAPRGRSYKATIRRRVAGGDGLPPSAWWLRSGSHASDVSLWIARGWVSPDPVERAIVQRFRPHVCDDRGNVVPSAWRDWYPVVALCFTLFYARTVTRRADCSGMVIGRARPLLALWTAHRCRGLPVRPETISRYLARLKTVCGGLLEWHQPSPAAARHWGLPHALHYYSDGRVQPQAMNVYWWRKIYEPPPDWPQHDVGRDPSSCYGQDKEKTQSEVSPGAPGIHPGGPDPPTIAPAGVKPRS